MMMMIKNCFQRIDYQSTSPVPNSMSNSVLSQSLIQVTVCIEFVLFRANSKIYSELSFDSAES